ncbi:hypothetical protein EYF80_059464 [Liparis tanakae]|uniref:Uncharacterized protein n=1 Tax=Liparis tanakae TaxID=230148 RepID=A0A4Z2ENQ9_9TELE|nr:hypothetical protein EYF80_059464 [Liparis tanakae]
MTSGSPGEGTLWIFHPGLGDKGLGSYRMSCRSKRRQAASQSHDLKWKCDREGNLGCIHHHNHGGNGRRRRRAPSAAHCDDVADALPEDASSPRSASSRGAPPPLTSLSGCFCFSSFRILAMSLRVPSSSRSFSSMSRPSGPSRKSTP